jgi:hypothetical protein
MFQSFSSRLGYSYPFTWLPYAALHGYIEIV